MKRKIYNALSISFLLCMSTLCASCVGKGKKISSGYNTSTTSISSTKSTTSTTSVETHTHSFGSSYMKDENKHWKECECGVVDQESAHSFSEWSEVTPSTHSSKGKEERTCYECGYKDERDLSLVPHEFSTTYSCDKDKHWQECECGATTTPENHTFVDGYCSVCGKSQYSEGLEYYTSGSEVYISSIGTCTDEDIVIPLQINGYPVRGIADSAFQNNKNIKSVTLPVTVFYIKGHAFENCSNLESINFPDGIQQIKSMAFSGCSSLKSISLPQACTSIDSYAFYQCSSLKTVELKGVVTTLEDSLFKECSALESINLPVGLTKIGDETFSGCTSLKSISIPKTVTTIRYNSFKGCGGLESISVDPENTSYHSPSNCNAIIQTNNGCVLIGCKNTTFTTDMKLLSEYAFYNCVGLEEVYIPSTVTSINLNSFYGCSSVKKIEVDPLNTAYDSRDNCNAIINTTYNRTLFGCVNTTIPSSISKIGTYTFIGITDLTSIVIPINITYIDDAAFRDCKNLTDVYYEGTEEQWASINNSFSGLKGSNITVHYNYVAE